MTVRIIEDAKQYFNSLGCNELIANLCNGPKIRETAKFVYQSRAINAAYATLDGLIISYSVFKYYFDILTSSTGTASDVMHQWMLTRLGRVEVIAASAAILYTSCIGNIFMDDDKKSKFNQMVYDAWPYLRDLFKALKFSYRGIRSTLTLAKHLGYNYQSLTNPLGIIVGVAAALNRSWYRKTVMEKRKAYKTSNNDLIKQAKALGDNYDFCEMPEDEERGPYEKNKLYLKIDKISGLLRYRVYDPHSNPQLVYASIPLDTLFNPQTTNPNVADLKKYYSQQILFKTLANKHTTTTNTKQQREEMLAKIKRQDTLPHWRAMLSSVYAGLSDGLYTYMAIFAISALTGALLTNIAICNAGFVLLCIINRCHEESEFQRELRQSELSAELVLYSKDIEELFWMLHEQSERDANSDTLGPFHHDESGALKLERLKKTRDELERIVSLSYTRAALKGLRAGLYAYSAVCGAMLITSMSYLITTGSAIIPPAVIVLGILAGIISLILTTLHSLYINHCHIVKQKNNEKELKFQYNSLGQIIEAKTSSREIGLTSDQEKYALLTCMVVEPSPQYPVQETFDTLRSGLTGIAGKGQKAIDFLCNGYLVPGENGHYQETPTMTKVGLMCSLLYGGIYALKTFGSKLRSNDKELPVPLSSWPPPENACFSPSKKQNNLVTVGVPALTNRPRSGTMFRPFGPPTALSETVISKTVTLLDTPNSTPSSASTRAGFSRMFSMFARNNKFTSMRDLLGGQEPQSPDTRRGGSASPSYFPPSACATS